MTRVYLFLLCCVWLLLVVRCGGEGERVAAVSTPLNASTPTHAVVLTNTAVPPTPTQPLATDTPMGMETALLPTITVTVSPTTAVPTETPTITPISLPPLPGEIYFFWDSKHLPRGEVFDPVQTLYRISGENLKDVEISTVADEIIGWPYISLSPDKTAFLFTKLEDRNGDGNVSFEGYNQGFDGPNIFTYSLINRSVTRITKDFPTVINPEWGEGDETILFGQSTSGLSSIHVANGITQLVAAFPEDLITWTDVSPNGRLIGINLDSILISIVDQQTGEVTGVTHEIGGLGVERAWSPDSKWLLLNQPFTNRRFLVNVQTLTASPLMGLTSFQSFAWPPDSQKLTFVQDTGDGSSLMSLDPTDLSTRKLFSVPGSIHNLFWSPDGSHLAMTISVGEKIALHILDAETGELRELWQNSDSKRFYIAAWSPDGEWLLFFRGRGWPLSHGPDDEAGIYITHQSGGEAHLILDTSNASDPYGFFWLPEIQVP
ncbi:MAG: PD40 domain-containing protein [Chloroflexi bacterium]|nr:PD40 domain-containing protein [Chloroflexota bacterium]